ncbi:hypothetical protein AAFP30_20625 [Gordonia sp. CPCC 205515]|uniref:hypothetical protein n=1 Tax=Gordonia sp. CPCC 205515 TaxID=3140791 RepID=UPI003AF3AD1D
MTRPSTTILADGEGAAALLTIGIAVYAAVILVAIGLGINAIQHGRKNRAIAMAVVVGVLTVAGVVVAVISAVA